MAVDKTQLEMVRNKYGTEWDHDWQQLTERVRPYTTSEPRVAGKYFEFPRIGGTEVKEYNDTRHKVEFSDLNFGKRGMRYRKFYNAIPFSIDEADDMMDLDYTFAQIKEAQKPAAARFMDAIALGVIKDKGTGKWRLKTSDDEGFCGGILGTNYGGDDGVKSFDLDLTYDSFQNRKGNLIPVDYATTGTGVSKSFAGTFIDRLTYVKRLLEEKEVFNGVEKGEICVAISPAVKQLLQSLELRLNRDYGFNKLGEAGNSTYNESLNITFLVTNMLPTMDTENKEGTDIAGARMCCAWLRSRIKFGTWRDTMFTMKDVDDMVDVDNYLRVKGKAGCGRMDEDTVFVLPEVEVLGA